jgi:hypothetical protein
VQARNRDLIALEQQTATSDVLQVINRSTLISRRCQDFGQLGRTLCQAENVQIFLRDGELFRLKADAAFHLSTRITSDVTRSPRSRYARSATALTVAPVHMLTFLLIRNTLGARV